MPNYSSDWHTTFSAAVLLFSGCAVAPAQFHIQAPFDGAAAAAQVLPDGQGALRGNAFLRQRGGGVVTCAGSPVVLIPATAYANERIQALYGSNLEGLAPVRDVIFTPPTNSYVEHTRSTRCDAQGNFSFERVRAGTFYVITTVTWEAGGARQGGHLMKRIEVSDSPQSFVMSR